MNDFIENIKSFNRKERYFLVKYALQEKEENEKYPGFKLSKKFKEALENVLPIKIPPDAYAAMDYHLDWIYASLVLAVNNKGKDFQYKRDEEHKCISGTQEDIDFIIAFKGAEKTYHVVLVEAKADTSWSNSQMKSKSERLEKIFNTATGEIKLKPYLVLTSPREPDPNKLDCSEWAQWMKREEKEKTMPYWIPLEMPINLKSVECCNEKRADKNGSFWRIK
jgi:hypothetical protein